MRDCLSVYARSAGALDVNTVRAETMDSRRVSAPEDAATIVKSREQHPVTDYTELAPAFRNRWVRRERVCGSAAGSMYTLRATARLRQPDGKLSDLRRTVAALVQIQLPGQSRREGAGL